MINRRNRLIISAAVGVLAAFAGSAVGESSVRGSLFSDSMTEKQAVTAWWGTLYPEFCFSRQIPENYEDPRLDGEVKISFWLAKALDW